MIVGPLPPPIGGVETFTQAILESPALASFDVTHCDTTKQRPKSTQGRVLAMEILVPNPAVRNLIREDKVHQIYSSMQTGQAKYGMQTFNQSLANHYFNQNITLETAMSRSSLPEELHEMMEEPRTEVVCQFCGRKYHFTREDLLTLMATHEA